jgi:hypothetical protein
MGNGDLNPCSASAACVSGRRGRSAKVSATLESAEADATIGCYANIDKSDFVAGNNYFVAS